MSQPFVLVLYYSRHGSVLNLAKSIAKGIESRGVEARIRTVPELDQTRGNDAPYPEVEIQDIVECAGLAMGSPCHFGMMASPLKFFWETTSTQWLRGDMIDKPAAVFTSSSSLHGGNESTLLSMSLPLLHHGFMLLGVPYSVPELNSTTSGGTPYGASHVSGLSGTPDLSNDEKNIAIALGKRLASTSLALIKD
jgi:NAD(P)H dehydrogenase (quinone)